MKIVTITINETHDGTMDIQTEEAECMATEKEIEWADKIKGCFLVEQ